VRRTVWYVLFVKRDDPADGQPAFIEGGRRYRAIQRVASRLGKGWKLSMAIRSARNGARCAACLRGKAPSNKPWVDLRYLKPWATARSCGSVARLRVPRS
jgi:hypothetical protein